METKHDRLLHYAIVVLLVAILVLTLFQIGQAEISPYQTYTDIKRMYDECKAQAPEGFDCVIEPVMVSDSFFEE